MPIDVDFIEAGGGPLVILIHSSVSGARQWRKLIEALAPTRHVKAVNLFGYGRTPAWSAGRAQTFDDHAELVEALIPAGASDIALVGHSFGGAVAMTTALRLGGRVNKLVLLEPNPFYLLHDHGRVEAFAEIMRLRDVIKTCGARGDWEPAAAQFADYWGGEGVWSQSSPERRAAFIEALKPNFHEWDVFLGELTPLHEWAARLPRDTLVVHDPATKRPILEIVELLAAATPWRFTTIAQGGHMAPLSHPEIVNPIIAKYLAE